MSRIFPKGVFGIAVVVIAIVGVSIVSSIRLGMYGDGNTDIGFPDDKSETVLDIRNRSAKELLQLSEYRHLRSASLRNSELSEEVASILARLPDLRYLDIENCTGANGNFFKKLKGSGIIDLSIYESDELDDDSATHIINIGSLQVLSVNRCKNLSDDFVLIVSKSNTLERVDIHCSKITTMYQNNFNEGIRVYLSDGKEEE